MAIETIRITSVNDRHYAKALELYAQSFPFHEQREAYSQSAIMSHPDYHFDMMLDDGNPVGIILNWHADMFIYVEHLCIMPALRGKGYGKMALSMLASYGKTVILEIDPPVDAVSIRRKHFYEAAGYVENPYPHVHPPYHSGHCGHDLVVMSCPHAIDAAQYEGFSDYLHAVVMDNAYA